MKRRSEYQATPEIRIPEASKLRRCPVHEEIKASSFLAIALGIEHRARYYGHARIAALWPRIFIISRVWVAIVYTVTVTLS